MDMVYDVLEAAPSMLQALILCPVGANLDGGCRNPGQHPRCRGFRCLRHTDRETGYARRSNRSGGPRTCANADFGRKRTKNANPFRLT